MSFPPLIVLFSPFLIFAQSIKIEHLSGLINSYGTEFNFVLLRPLLTFSKKELLDYASTKNLSWIEDESNLDTKISRNYIRKIVFPILYKVWPDLSKSFLYLSKQARDAKIILDEVKRGSYFYLSQPEGHLCPG